MALHKVKKPESIQKNNINKEEEKQPMNTFNNLVAGESNSIRENVINGVENTLKDVVEERRSNVKSDSFFDSEELSGTSTPIDGVEIEIEPEIAIAEGRYKFNVKNLKLEKQVETKYGVKDKLVVEFHISRIRYEEEFAYDLKQKYNISNSRKSSFYKLYTDLTGKAPMGKINLRNLLGVKGYCEVKHILLDNRDIFPRIVNINAEIYKDSSEVPAV